MNCKWFEFSSSFYFWLLKICVPQNALEDKRENCIFAQVREEERMCCSAAMWCAVFHILKALPGIPLSEDQHPSSEWFTNLIPEGSGAQVGEVSRGWGALCCPVPRISSPVKLMLLSSHSVLCIKSSVIPGLCLVNKITEDLYLEEIFSYLIQLSYFVSHTTMLTSVQGTCLEVCVALTLEVIF